MAKTSADGKERAKFLFVEENGYGNVLRVSGENIREFATDCGVAVFAGGRLGPGANGLTEREIAEAFRIYHEHTDPKLPVACRYTGNRLGIGEYSWAITQESIEAFEQILTWLHWKLEQQKEPDGG